MLMRVYLALLWVFLLLGQGAGSLSAQDLKLMLSRSVYLKHSGIQQATDPYLNFVNINKLPYYNNEKQLREILQMESSKSKDLKTLSQAMEDYVLKFGIQNFRQNADLDYIWKLG